jgi:1-deoxy-D-xylulose-5-phosphate reductoisomerase
MGKTASAVLNAANEEAVDAFLQGAIAFTAIATLNAKALDNIPLVEPSSISDVLNADKNARAFIKAEIATIATKSSTLKVAK